MKIVHIFLSAATLASAISPASLAAEPPPDREIAAKADAYVRSFADSGLFSGVVLIRHHGQTIYEKAYGMAERSFQVPLTTDTRFMIASVSKPITSAAIGRLVDLGKLSFDDPISRYISGIPNGDKITIEQLLNHHSGLDSPDRLTGSDVWMRLPNTTENLVDRVRAMPPAFKPGERYYYANANYWILAHLIEKLSGMTYGDFLEREIFRPVGMSDSGHRGDLLHVVPRLAYGYAPEGLHDYRLADLVDWTSKTGNGSLYSTADDLVRFYEALSTSHLLKPETTRRVFGEGQPMGYAWFHHDNPDPSRHSVWFNGRSPGFTAYIEAYPVAGLTFIILSNLYVYSPTVMANGFEKLLWGEPFQSQMPIHPASVSAVALRELEGMYKFGPTFFVRNGQAQVVSRGDHLIMRWQTGGLVTTLIPLGNNVFFDPTFWSTISFEHTGDETSIKYKAYGFAEVYAAIRLDAR